MSFKKFAVIFSSIILLAAASGTALADPPLPSATVTITATPGTSTGSIVPDNSGQADQYFYVYDINVGDSISDSIPVHICTTTAYTGTNTFSYTLVLSFSGPNGDSIGVGLPTDPSFSTDGCQDVSISLNSGPFNTAGDFAANTTLQRDSFDTTGGGSHNTTDPTGTSIVGLHIQVHVTQPTSGPSCFITDSDFNFLLDCSGQAVHSGSGGRFAIVANKKGIEVATNPGQFYYNLLWTNHTGSDQTVTVTFVRIGVIPQGAQAIHASIFPSFPDLSGFNFDVVNSGIPSGSDDALENVVVPNGSTLWVDYHLEWAGLGGPSSTVPLTCDLAGTNCFSVQATLTSGTNSLGTCTAGACGYLKH